MEIKCTVILVTSLFSIALTGCDRMSDKNTTRPQSVALPTLETMSYEQMVKGTPYENWINRAGATGIQLEEKTEPSSVLLKFPTSGEFISVVEDIKPMSGETYTFTVQLRAMMESSPEVRLGISRDCAIKEDFSIQSFYVDSSFKEYEISHTFSHDFPCMKIGITVLNASNTAPQFLELSLPKLLKSN